MSGIKFFPKVNSSDWAFIRHIAQENVIIVSTESLELGPEDFERDKI